MKKITNKELDKVLKICAAQNVVIDLKKTNKLQDNSLTQETKYKRRRTICKIEKKKSQIKYLGVFIRRNSNTLKTN